MALLKHINRLKYIDFMIKNKATGSLDLFARKNGLKKSAMSETIAEMRELGFPIKYCKVRNSYYYYEHGKLVNEFFEREFKVLSEQEILQINTYENICFSEINVFQVCVDSNKNG
jgi:hypothetical protein